MRIAELLEQTIGAVGSTTGSPGQVPQVSQPAAPGAATDPNKQAANPEQEKLAKLLMPHGIKDPAELTNATAALQAAMKNPNQLKPDQQELLGKLVNPLLKDQGFATAIKQLSTQKPGQPQTAPAQTPPAGAVPGTM